MILQLQSEKQRAQASDGCSCKRGCEKGNNKQELWRKDGPDHEVPPMQERHEAGGAHMHECGEKEVGRKVEQVGRRVEQVGRSAEQVGRRVEQAPPIVEQAAQAALAVVSAAAMILIRRMNEGRQGQGREERRAERVEGHRDGADTEIIVVEPNERRAEINHVEGAFVPRGKKAKRSEQGVHSGDPLGARFASTEASATMIMMSRRRRRRMRTRRMIIGVLHVAHLLLVLIILLKMDSVERFGAKKSQARVKQRHGPGQRTAQEKHAREREERERR